MVDTYISRKLSHYYHLQHNKIVYEDKKVRLRKKNYTFRD